MVQINDQETQVFIYHFIFYKFLYIYNIFLKIYIYKFKNNTLNDKKYYITIKIYIN